MVTPRSYILGREWVERWLPGDAHLLDAAVIDPAAFDPVRWALAWADCAVRAIVPLALDAIDLPGQATALRVLPAIESEGTGLEAVSRLGLAARTAAAMGPKHHFCASARLAAEEALVLLVAARDGQADAAEPTWRFQGMFCESGALDMVIHRSISAGAPREEVRAELLGNLTRLLAPPVAHPTAACAACAACVEGDAPDTEKTSADSGPFPANEAKPPPFSWMAPIGGAASTFRRSG